MTVLIENLQNKVVVEEKLQELLNKAVALCLQSEKFEIPVEISVLLIDDQQIREMNKEHRNIDKPTDVLSFPMVDMVEGRILSNVGDYDMDEELLLLGDIVISTEKAKEQAQEYGHGFEREMAFLVTHGVFHLLGYDHESPEDQGKMFKKQEDVLEMMGLTREGNR